MNFLENKPIQNYITHTIRSVKKRTVFFWIALSLQDGSKINVQHAADLSSSSELQVKDLSFDQSYNCLDKIA